MPSKSVQVLRKTAKFLRCVAEGAPTSLQDFKTFSDLCWLCVPMKYRMSKQEIAELAELKSHWKRIDLDEFDAIARGLGRHAE